MSSNQFQFIFTNALQIPNLFQGPYGTVTPIAFLLFSILFVVSVLHENLASIQGKSNFTGLFVRVLLILGLLLMYERFFTWIVYGMDLISKTVLPDHEFKEVVNTIFTEIVKKKDPGVLKFFSIVTVLNFVTYMIAMALLGVIHWLRFIFLSLLYVSGPILIAFGVYRSTSQGLTFWLKSLISVSAWTVVLSILMKVVATMNIASIYVPNDTNTVAVFAANVLFILLFLSVPLIAHMMTSGGTLSSLGSAVMGIGTALVTRKIVPAVLKQDWRGAREGEKEESKGGRKFK